ncbi:MAG: SEC-C domain-containing protein [Candidatus Bathyarchaeota archaeon]|nr:MAG: SEC-C domain-containing protein [Candidatus Bathyarchaeota archaeon]
MDMKNMFIFNNPIVLGRRRIVLSCGCGGAKTTKSDDPCPCGSGKKYKDCCEE